jgi:predicted Zn-dependent protease
MSVLLLAGCQSVINQTYPPSIDTTGDPAVKDTIDDQRAEIGASEHPRILASYGGEYNDPKVERQLAKIVGKLTLVSENPRQTYRITILDSPAVNAFALPGGYLYITRGLLALADDSSEIAAVIAHEMAHVTANHGLLRRQAEQAEQLASEVAEELLSGDVTGEQVAARGKLRLAAFSRQQELEADAIGVRMLGSAGFDPYAAARFLDTMEAYRQYQNVAQDSDPSLDFLSSHPDAPKRRELAYRHARAFGQPGVGDRDQDQYLRGIDGLVYGDSPKQGYVRGNAFLHPVLGIRFNVPRNFVIDNTAEAVLATGPGDIAIRFDGVSDRRKTPLTRYIQSGWVTGLDTSSIRSVTINGLDAATARALADKWVFNVTVIRVNDKIYRLLTAAPIGNPNLDATAQIVTSSFRKMSPSEIASLKPLRIEVVTVRPGETPGTLANRMEGTARKRELFDLLNAVSAGESLSVGRKVKLVTDSR